MERSVRTDLAVEVKESFDEDNVEIRGVILNKRQEADGITVTTVIIESEAGAEKMGKPMGTYVTIEDKRLLEEDEEHQEEVIRILVRELKQMYPEPEGKQILVVGLGNREVTLDSLGPRVIDGLFVTRHLIRELGEDFSRRNHLESVSGLAPGVMAQTGMETGEVIEGVCREICPDLVIVVDALAAGSKDRLAASLQITNTGICPGSGVGNDRKVLNRENLGAEVIAVGVPMVMDMEDERFFVTLRNIDEAVVTIADCISEGLNACFHGQYAVSGQQGGHGQGI